MNRLAVYDCGLPKIRLGKDNDGGYVIVKGLLHDCYLSCGIGNDLSFEKDFCSLYKNIESHVFDGTLLYKEEEIPGLQFHKINISNKCSEKETDLKEYLNKYSNVFIKMDIEGYEYDWLDSLSEKQLNNIQQIIIEFHGFERSLLYVEKLNKTHSLVHFHGNIYGGKIKYKDMDLPNVYEVTFVKKDNFKFNLNNKPLPSNIDQPNNPNHADFDLNFKPFVWI